MINVAMTDFDADQYKKDISDGLVYPKERYADHNDWKTTSSKGLRFNEGKPRYDLLPAHAIDQLVKVLSAGAKKYADRNWEKGMEWSSVVASLKRHLAKYEQGEDYDEETGMLHMAQVMWNAMAITEYYHTHPEYDDRPHRYLAHPKIGLDIDEVICDFVGGWCEKHTLPNPQSWNFDYATWDKFEQMNEDELVDFYLGLKPKVHPNDLPFEPHCYVTSRTVPIEVTQEWLQKNGFPTAPVYCVDFNHSKVEVAKQSGMQWFIDDRYENFVELNKNGICTFLWDAPWNHRYEVGYKRIKNFEDFKKRFL